MSAYRVAHDDNQIVFKNKQDRILPPLNIVPSKGTLMSGLALAALSGVGGTMGVYALGSFVLRDSAISMGDIAFSELFPVIFILSFVLFVVPLAMFIASGKGTFRPLTALEQDNCQPERLGQAVLDMDATRKSSSLNHYSGKQDELVNELNTALEHEDDAVEELLLALQSIKSNPGDHEADEAATLALLNRLGEILEPQRKARIAQASYINEQTAKAALEVSDKY